MAPIEDLSDAQIILLAVDLCCASNVNDLQALVNQVPDVLGTELVLRILLTFLPASAEPSIYLPALQHLAGIFSDVDAIKHVDTSSVDKIKDADAAERVGNLRLARLNKDSRASHESHDLVISFIFQRAYQIDSETRNLPAILQLAESFIEGSTVLKEWVISTLLPLVRSEYEYYTNVPLSIPLSRFETLDDRTAISTLLQSAREHERETQIGRDLRCLVGPWMYGDSHAKRRKIVHDGRHNEVSVSSSKQEEQAESGWSEVNHWILTRSQEDFNLAATAFLQWDGPSDVDLGGYADHDEMKPENGRLKSAYIQSGLALIYAAEANSQEIMNGSWRIFARAIYLSGPESNAHFNSSDTKPQIETSFPKISALSRASLLHNALLHSSNDLTRPTNESLAFLHGILTSVKVLRSLGTPLTCRKAVEICLFASEEVQKQELRNLLQAVAKSNKQGLNWLDIREQMFWLQRWGISRTTDAKHSRALFWRVDRTFLEMELLDALLTAAQYDFAVNIFLKRSDADSLTRGQVETVVERAILRDYDNASNGNRTRGGIKRASDILKAFRPHISPQSPIHKIEYLLAATHSLSFYHLTLQHGVPFQPVSIRVHSDPIELIGKVLEQDSKAYTKLDDLISIGQNFVKAGLPIHDSREDQILSQDKALLEAERRITYLAIEAALSASDFDTAYSYILTRLNRPTSTSASTPTSSDDYSWRAAYLAGRNRPKPPSTGPPPLSAQISSISKRMDLLSLALTLSPTPDPLPEILGTWRRCEEELSSLKSSEAAEEAAWDARGDTITSAVPGTFSPEGREIDIEETRRQQSARNRNKRYEEEAPMGLFDVARGAARAIGKSAFPLRAGAADSSSHAPTQSFSRSREAHPSSPTSQVETRASFESDRSGFSGGGGGGQRVRKRDMVSNMVTSGVVSGLGWVLGAQPVARPETPHGDE